MELILDVFGSSRVCSLGHNNTIGRFVHVLCTLVAAHLLLLLLVHKLVVDDGVSSGDYLLGASEVFEVASALA